MKITCIVGSARNNGSCNYLVDTFIKGALSCGAEIKKFCVSELNINYCCACKNCYKTGECVYDDDAKSVVENILTSDRVLIAAPSYWADIPAQLKTLFDRTTPYGDTNPNRILKAEKPIKGIAVAVRAGVRKQENELILNSIEHYFGHLGIETAQKIPICETDSLDDLLQKHQSELEQLFLAGKNIAGK